MGRFVDDDLLGKIGEMAVLQELNESYWRMGDDINIRWQTKKIFHVDLNPEGKHEGMAKYLQERGIDLVEIIKEYQYIEEIKDYKFTGKRKVIFHE